MDLSGILTTFIGSGLGIGTALLINHLADIIRDRKRIKIAKENIERELNIIRNNLLYPTGSDEITDEYIIFETPIWNSLVSTGDILTIRRSESFYNAALSSYRKITSMQYDDKNTADYNSAIKRIERVNYRRYVRDHLKNNLGTIHSALNKGTKGVTLSKEQNALKYEEKKHLDKIKTMFRSCAKGIIPEENIEESFMGRKIENKGLFFCTTNLNAFDEDNAIDVTYGIGFGEYNCEIYLSLSINTELGIGQKSKAILSNLDALEKVKTGEILRTSYEKTGEDRINYNYSRFILASNLCNDKFDKETIDEITITKMLEMLLEFENEWLTTEN